MSALIAAMEAVNAASPFNRLAGFRVTAAREGAVTLAGEAKAELMNHAGALHAGVQSALLDTVCGFAAGSVAGTVVTASLTVHYLSSAKGDHFEARAGGEGWPEPIVRGGAAVRLSQRRGGPRRERDGGAGEADLGLGDCA